jgi:3(or 17)beta-hydroxysteroid dehydrogenase
MGRVAGKVAIITGAATGLGAADAAMLAREGAQVILTDVNPIGEQTAAAIPGAIFIRHDVTRPEDWANVMETVQSRFGRLDVLVNNAGIVIFETIEECSLENFRKHYAVHVEGTFLGCQNAIRLMKANGGGSIINMASTTALVGYSLVPAYTAAKGAIRSLTRNVAVHCQEQGYNIRANVVFPGIIATAMMQASIDEVVKRGIPMPEGDPAKMPKPGAPDDIANLILYLASDESRLINAAEFVIDDASVAR